MSFPLSIPAYRWHGQIDTYEDWLRFRNAPPFSIAKFRDNFDRECVTPEDFERARDENAFPIGYYW
ncbi:MAG TPA: hypothetical protein VEK82_00935 [Stellaceae bacterium]|nr:hypothetical protein [Stellaceae bacterium]